MSKVINGPAEVVLAKLTEPFMVIVAPFAAAIVIVSVPRNPYISIIIPRVATRALRTARRDGERLNDNAGAAGQRLRAGNAVDRAGRALGHLSARRHGHNDAGERSENEGDHEGLHCVCAVRYQKTKKKKPKECKERQSKPREG